MAKFINVKPIECHSQSQTTSSSYSSPSVSNQISTSYNTKQRKLMPSIAIFTSEMATYDPDVFKPLEEQPIDLTTFKRLKFVMLDPMQIETREIYDTISSTFQWEVCESQNWCISYIRDKCANYRVFLIICGSMGRNVVPLIHGLPQTYCVYVYCADVLYNQEWTKIYSKVRVVCNNDDQYLLPQFAVDVAQANIDWGNALLSTGKYDEAKNKFEKALENLTKYARRPDPAMVNQHQNS
ncbi:unnamed protein product [Rotaria sordida]|uniref:Uncharacterized protein n=1 Tax=Rotaria sordida TaxID=392033 RepID=A0A815ITS9_9BILA|nr:unnamed protein product [Rotaria sordida]CAF3923792.1 unnamed protein product [Rotaria sordida]